MSLYCQFLAGTEGRGPVVLPCKHGILSGSFMSDGGSFDHDLKSVLAAHQKRPRFFYNER